MPLPLAAIILGGAGLGMSAAGLFKKSSDEKKGKELAQGRYEQYSRNLEDELYGFNKQKGAGYEMLKYGLRGQGRQLMSQAKSYRDPAQRSLAMRGAQRQAGLGFGDIYQSAATVEAQRRNQLLGMKGNLIGARSSVDMQSPLGSNLRTLGGAFAQAGMGVGTLQGGKGSTGGTSGMSLEEMKYLMSPSRQMFMQSSYGNPQISNNFYPSFGSNWTF